MEATRGMERTSFMDTLSVSHAYTIRYWLGKLGLQDKVNPVDCDEGLPTQYFAYSQTNQGGSIRIKATSMTELAGGRDDWNECLEASEQLVNRFLIEKEDNGANQKLYDYLFEARCPFYRRIRGAQNPQEAEDMLNEDLEYYVAFHLLKRKLGNFSFMVAGDSRPLHKVASILAETDEDVYMIFGGYARAGDGTEDK
jgi:hypothetical protein